MNRARVKWAAAVVALGALLAVVLEAGTLVGARTASPLVLADWSRRRMAVFFVVCLALLAWYAYGRLSGGLRGPREAVRDLAPGSVRRVAVSLGVALLAAVDACLVCWAVVSLGFGVAWDARYGWIAAIVAAVPVLLVINRQALRKRLEWGYLILALGFGTLFCVCMPTIALVSWDGQIHIRNAIAVSYVRNAEYSQADQLMTQVDLVVDEDIVGAGELSGLWNPKQDTQTTNRVNDLLLAGDDKDVVRMEGTNTLAGSSWVAAASVGYVPNAMGLWLGRLLGLSCLGQYFLAREVSVIVFALVFFCAIRRLKSGKAILAVLGLLPTGLLMAANFAYDPWCFAFVSYGFARYVGLVQRRGEGPSGFDTLSAMGAFFLGALVKAVIFPLALVLFVVPRGAFANRRRRIAWRAGAVLVVVCLLVSFALPFVFSVSSGNAGGDLRGGSDVSSGGQVAYILANPLAYAWTFLTFTLDFLSPLNATSVLNTFSGFPYLALEPERIAAVAVAEWALVAGAVVLDRTPDDAPYGGWKDKLSVVVGAFCAFLLVATALYVSFTGVGRDTIAGVQYRYLLPFLVPVFLVGCNCSRLWCRRPKGLSLAVVGAEYALMLVTTFNMFVVAF